MQKPVSTIPQFCDDHDLSKSYFYKMQKLGIGPKVMKVGRRSFVTPEAAAAWRAKMEEKSSNVEGA